MDNFCTGCGNKLDGKKVCDKCGKKSKTSMAEKIKSFNIGSVKVAFKNINKIKYKYFLICIFIVVASVVVIVGVGGKNINKTTRTTSSTPDPTLVNKYTSSNGDYRYFNVKTDEFFQKLIKVGPDYGWTIDRNVTKKEASQNDQLLGIKELINLKLDNVSGEKAYLRVFCDINMYIVQVEWYSYDHHNNEENRKMLIKALFEDGPTNYSGELLKEKTWSIWLTNDAKEYDGTTFNGMCIGVKSMPEMPISSLYRSAKDFMLTSDGGFSFKAHISKVEWGSTSVGAGNKVYMDIILSVMDSEGHSLGKLTTPGVDVNSHYLTSYVHYTGEKYEFVFICDKAGNLQTLPTRVTN